MCVDVYMSIYPIYICTCKYVYIYVYMCTYMCTYVYMDICVHIHIRLYLFMYIVLFFRSGSCGEHVPRKQ